MRHELRPFLAFVGAVYLLAIDSCAPAENAANTPSTAFVSGKITNHQGDFVFFEFGDSCDTLALDSSGSFQGELSLENACYVTFRDVNERAFMYLSPGDSVVINLDTEAFDETIRYEGRGAGPNNFLAARFLRYEDPMRRERQASVYNAKASLFLHVNDSIRQADTQFLQSAINSFELPDAFVQNEMNTLLYTHANQLLVYHGNCRTNGSADTLGFEETYFAFLKEAELVRPDLLENEYYLAYADARINYLAYDSLKARGDSIFYTSLNRERIGLISSLFSEEKLKNKLLISNMAEIVDFHGLDDLSLEFELFSKACSDTTALTELRSEYAEWQKITAGNSVPEFSFEQADGQSIALSSLKGRAIYIDVWATWCGPCKREMPHLEELQKSLSKDAIHFVSISVDEDRQAWETMADEQALGGYQFITGSGWESPFTEHFKVNSIPRFILLDHEGKIISADAPRPSWGEETLSMLKKAANSAKSSAI
jgi:thiol-disulfide isomerase/thioredoxin